MKKPLSFLFVLIFLLSAVATWAEESDHEMHRGEKIARFLEDKGFSTETAVVSISTLPIVELRGAVPAGHILYNVFEMDGAGKMKMSLWIFALAVAGNMLPIPFILLLLGPVSNVLMRFPIGKRFFEWLFARTRKKSASIEKYEALGLTLFVAIPLPVTGGWTGAMAAFLMGIPFAKAMLYILMGVMIAGVIMTVLTLLGWLGAFIAGAVLLALAAGTVLKTFKTNGEQK
ncbi:MAG: small multi-drug export protein [Verrucomicrobiota bacterium]